MGDDAQRNHVEYEQHKLLGVVKDCQVMAWVEVDGVRVLALQLHIGGPHGGSSPVVLGLTPEAVAELRHHLDTIYILGIDNAEWSLQ